MLWTDYVDAATQTAADHPPTQRLAQAALGIVGELQEVADAPPDERDDEIGDVWWYVALLADVVRYETGDMPPPGCEWAPGDTLVSNASYLCEHIESIAYQGELVSAHIDAIRSHFRHLCRGLRRLTDTPVEQIWQTNADKLAARHPDGFETRSDP